MSEKERNIQTSGSGEQPAEFEFPREKSPQQLSETGAPKEEFDFYQDRFKGMAERHNQRRFIDRLVDKVTLKNDKPARPKKITKEYVMQELAERENKDLKRREEEERREWDKKLKPVIEALKLKRDDPEGEGRKRKVLILALGGGLKGPYGAGQVIALNEMGITADKIDVLVGASSGMADLVYYAGGSKQTYIGTSIYYDECGTKEFLDMMRLTHVMDSRVAAQAMREGEKAIDREEIMRIPTEVYAVVAPVNGTEVELVDIKKAKPDMIAPLEASMNVRLLRAPGTGVNEGEYEDGSFGTLPVQKLIDQFHPTDIIILPQSPFKKIEEFAEAGVLLDRLPHTGSLGTARKFMKLSAEMRSMLTEFKEKQGVNIGVLWPKDSGLDSVDSDPDLIKFGVVEAARDTIRQFGGQQPEKINLYIPEKFRKQPGV